MECNLLQNLVTESLKELEIEIECDRIQTQQCIPKLDRNTNAEIIVEFVDSEEFDKYRAKQLGSLRYPEETISVEVDTAILKKNNDLECNEIYHHYAGNNLEETCLGIFYTCSTQIERAPSLVRINSDIDEYGVSKTHPDKAYLDKYSGRDKKGKLKYKLSVQNAGKERPTGFFRKVAKEKGRERVKEKLGPFIENFQSILELLWQKLDTNGFKEGDDIVVMVVNEGEIDLFLNFACSCQLHDIPLSNVLVFAGSSEISSLIEATGAMAMYHEEFAAVSKRASMDYLDRVFVDMMWYKAFSVYILIRKRFNILFQDVDLVWFKDPLPFFHNFIKKHQEKGSFLGSKVEAFFSDDGQRSMRYTPFYANSGFYYLQANERSEYFLWSIMKAFDSVQVLGSHQNVLTMKLIEGLGTGYGQTKLLSLHSFPNGILYHHDRDYMDKLRNHKVKPYGFHMCWTQGKLDKLEYLKKSLMWYVTEECSPLDALIADNIVKKEDGSKIHMGPGTIYNYVEELKKDKPVESQWKALSSRCCVKMDNAP